SLVKTSAQPKAEAATIAGASCVRRLPGGGEWRELTRHASYAACAPAATVRRASGVLKALRHFAAGLGELDHQLLVEPDVHCGRAVERAGIAELPRQLLARAEAAVQLEELHQIDDRCVPIEVLVLLVGELRNHRLDVRLRHRLAGRRRRRRGGARRCSGICSLGPENRRCDLSKDAHVALPDLPCPRLPTGQTNVRARSVIIRL